MTSQVARGSKTSGQPSPSRRMQVTPYESSTTVLPELRSRDHAIDKSKPLPTSLQSDFIPEDLLIALVQPNAPFDKLGPLSRYRNLSTSVLPARRPPDNVWNNPKQRQKYKHLTDNVPCVCGAGKDVSFLYDVPKKEEKTEKPNKLDPSSQRIQQSDDDEPVEEEKKCPSCHRYVFKKLALPDSLIPEEYHIVKNRGVMGLEYHEDKFASQTEDHEKHLVMFPSMKPVSRYEVQQLRKTMEKMLEDISIMESSEAPGPTQMHNLLELIKKEQDIYNLIFHELIRQVSVECSDRGELLSELRSKYSHLLNRVPMQVKGLHEEVLAQRALDRRLTEELLRFKVTIVGLTEELREVKEHDTQVTQQAGNAQKELKVALQESAKNASLLAEYHELYELQRRRLEANVASLSAEKEIWSAAAYSLALKVTEESSLNTAKRLHVAEKAWAKLATHFTILLSDKDTETLTELQGFVDRFRDLLDEFNRYLCNQEETMKEQLALVKKGIHHWHNYFRKYIFKNSKFQSATYFDESRDGHLLKALDRDRISQLYDDLRSWETIVTSQSEKFSGDMFLAGEDAVKQIRKQVEGWTQAALQVFGRHHVDPNTNYPDHAFMLKMNEGKPFSKQWANPHETAYDQRLDDMNAVKEDVERLLKQYYIRITGENGVATCLIHVSNSLDTWMSRLQANLFSSTHIPDAEWLRFYQLLDDWTQVLEETSNAVGYPLKEGEKIEQLEDDKKPLEVSEMMKITQNWLTSTSNGIDNEDSKLVENVSSLHTEMVQWMVQVLLRLAPDRADHSEEARRTILMGSAPIPTIIENCSSISGRLFSFSSFVTNCVVDSVNADAQERLSREEEDAEHEQKELARLMQESKDWMMTARVLLSELTGEPVPVNIVLPATAANQKPPQPNTLIIDREDTQATVDSIRSAEQKRINSLTFNPPQDKFVQCSSGPIPEEEFDTFGFRNNATTTFDLEIALKYEELDELYLACQHSIENHLLSIREKDSPSPLEEGEENVTAPAMTPDPASEAAPEPGLLAPSDAVAPEGTDSGQTLISEEVSQQDVAPPVSSETEQPETPDPKKAELQVLGQDANTHTHQLQDRSDMTAMTAQGDSSDQLHPYLSQQPLTPNTKKAYEALSAVGELQQQLISTEERAQTAEEKAISYENELKEAQEKIRALERLVAKTPDTLPSSDQSKPVTARTIPEIRTPTPSDDGGGSQKGSSRSAGKKGRGKSSAKKKGK